MSVIKLNIKELLNKYENDSEFNGGKFKIPKIFNKRASPIKIGKTTKRASPKRASPKRASPKRVSPKRVSPKRVSPKRVSPKRVSPKRVSPKRVSPKRASPDGKKPSSLTDRLEKFGKDISGKVMKDEILNQVLEIVKAEIQKELETRFNEFLEKNEELMTKIKESQKEIDNLKSLLEQGNNVEETSELNEQVDETTDISEE